MKWQTKVRALPHHTSFYHGDAALSMGSCFADEVGSYLSRHMVDILVNPLGIVYNPASLARHVTYLMADEVKLADQWLHVEGTWRHADFHSVLHHVDQDQAAARILSSIEHTKHHIRQACLCIITAGTAMVWRDQKGRIVANCHKQPAGTYTRDMLTTTDCAGHLSTCVEGLRQINPDLSVILTVSPVRHLRDGAVMNARSKARLLEANHQICASLPDVTYFPSYEILLDELRDYRFYAEDMIHPSHASIDYIAERFIQVHYSATDPDVWALTRKLFKLTQHRPMHDEDWPKKRADKMRSIQERLVSDHGVKVKDEVLARHLMD